jgi:hypothetical protein
VNDVRGPISAATARKLRSAAAALLADSEQQADARLADSLMYEAGRLRERADWLEASAPIEEPTEYGSIIRARASEYEEWVRWSKPTAEPGWFSEFGAFVGGYQMLRDVEVLRIGVGPLPTAPSYPDRKFCIGGMLDHPAHRLYCPACSQALS